MCQYMFTNLKLKNFKSFKNVEVDLQSKKNISKPLVIIYGENSSGKTTLTQALLTLRRTMATMQLREMLKDLLDDKINPPENFPLKSEFVLELLKSKLSPIGIESIIKDYKLINSTENMSIEYEFNIDGGNGSYYLETDNTKVVKECLEFTINKNKGCYFNIDHDNMYINENIFESKDFNELIKSQVEMYWGKHTLLSILNFEMEDKADAYINSTISTNLIKLITSFANINFLIPKDMDGQKLYLNSENKLFGQLVSGTIAKDENKKLDMLERLINEFFKSLFNDVVKAFYKKSNIDENIEYQLFLRKHIEDYEYDINFELESNGTKEIMNLLPYLVSAVSGSCVIIDEYGIGIHDLLSDKLLAAIGNQIKGQLIITTHNTLLMDDMNINPEALYFIMNDKTFKKSVKCVTEIEERLHPNYNYRKRYFSNSLYKDALPDLKNCIDLESLASLY